MGERLEPWRLMIFDPFVDVPISSRLESADLLSRWTRGSPLLCLAMELTAKMQM